MGFIKKTEEQQLVATAAKQEQLRQQKEATFRVSPVGRARTAFAQGDRVFQVNLEVMKQTAEIVAMIGSYNTRKANNRTS